MNLKICIVLMYDKIETITVFIIKFSTDIQLTLCYKYLFQLYLFSLTLNDDVKQERREHLIPTRGPLLLRWQKDVKWGAKLIDLLTGTNYSTFLCDRTMMNYWNLSTCTCMLSSPKHWVVFISSIHATTCSYDEFQLNCCIVALGNCTMCRALLWIPNTLLLSQFLNNNEKMDNYWHMHTQSKI